PGPQNAHPRWPAAMSTPGPAAVVAPGSPLAIPPEPPALVARTEVDGLLALDLEGYLPDDLLAKIDRAGMAASLEARAPFVNHHLVEFACRLPITHNLRGLQTKRVLRRPL